MTLLPPSVWFRRALFIAVVTLTLSGWGLGPVAFAQNGADKAAAEALFSQGKDAFKAENYAEACQKFDASNKLDPAVGTLLFLGECNERQGKTASAWAAFKQAASLAQRVGDGKRKKIAEVRVAALAPQISKLTVQVSEAPEGLSVRRDGVALPKASWGTPLPVDAGEVRIDATAPGREPWSTTLRVSDGGEIFTVDVPTLEPVAGDAPPTTPPVTGAETPEDDMADEGGSDLGTTLEITGLTVAGLGGVGLVVGTVFAVLAKGTYDDSLEACRTETLCSQEGLDLRDEADSQALVSSITIPIGGALVAGGLLMFFLAPDDDSSPEVGHLSFTPQLGPGHAGLTLRGAW